MSDPRPLAPREVRHCTIHGTTDFALHGDHRQRWVCLACDRERRRTTQSLDPRPAARQALAGLDGKSWLHLPAPRRAFWDRAITALGEAGVLGGERLGSEGYELRQKVAELETENGALREADFQQRHRLTELLEGWEASHYHDEGHLCPLCAVIRRFANELRMAIHGVIVDTDRREYLPDDADDNILPADLELVARGA